MSEPRNYIFRISLQCPNCADVADAELVIDERLMATAMTTGPFVMQELKPVVHHLLSDVARHKLKAH